MWEMFFNNNKKIKHCSVTVWKISTLLMWIIENLDNIFQTIFHQIAKLESLNTKEILSGFALSLGS